MCVRVYVFLGFLKSEKGVDLFLPSLFSRELLDRRAALSEETLLNMAKHFSNTYDCVQLAVYLQITPSGSGFIESLQSADPRIPPAAMAFEVFKRWKREHGVRPRGSGSHLYAVLDRDMNFGYLAEKFKHDLLQGKKSVLASNIFVLLAVHRILTLSA